MKFEIITISGKKPKIKSLIEETVVETIKMSYFDKEIFYKTGWNHREEKHETHINLIKEDYVEKWFVEVNTLTEMLSLAEEIWDGLIIQTIEDKNGTTEFYLEVEDDHRY